MSAGSGASSTKGDWRQRFRSIWDVDFEFREDANHLPIPICMFGREQHSGATLSLWRDELLRSTRAPFDTGPDSVMLAFASNAELQCFLALDWPFPANVLDAYVENIVAINGNTAVWPPADEKNRKGRPGLLDTLKLHGLPGTGRSQEEKERIRRMILDNENYTPEQRQEIQDYNRDDVFDTDDVVDVLAPTIDIDHALFRGRYMAAVAREERVGLPVDSEYLLNELAPNWDAIRLHYIQRDDEFHLYDGVNFVEERLWDLIEAKGWDWPRTPTGKYQLNIATIGRQATRYPELKSLARLRDQIAELRLNKLVNTIGADGFSRCPLLPFWTITGRNQPSARDKMFLPGLPKWLHGALKPPRGMALVELDFVAEEPTIVAGLSGDPAMIADCDGDVHWLFAVRAGLAAPDAAVDDRIRDLCKPVCHGMNYGITSHGIAAKTKKSRDWAREMQARHRKIYHVFHQWRGDVVAQAQFDERIVSPFGFPLIVTANTKPRTLMNFLAQAGGGDVMQLVSIVATECGVTIAAPVHDAFWILAPLDELDTTIARMSAIMTEAGRLVAGIPIRVKVEAVVRWPQCLGDVRKPDAKGQALWCEIRDLVRNGGLQKVSNA